MSHEKGSVVPLSPSDSYAITSTNYRFRGCQCQLQRNQWAEAAIAFCVLKSSLGNTRMASIAAYANFAKDS